jgi:hypothetical protein
MRRYYPKSQVKTNLYTNGNEYFFAFTLEPYSGYYYETSDGKYFSGLSPSDPTSQELVKNIITEQAEVNVPPSTNFNYVSYSPTTIDYLNTNVSITPSTLEIPTYNPILPTQQDYQIGTFRRYFCKKTNELIYIEINQNTFDKLSNKDPQILWQLYFPFNLLWTLTGDKQQVAKTNRNITLLAQQQFNLPKLNLYLKEDYLKYYLAT